MLRDYWWILSVLLEINASSGLELWQKHIRPRNLGHDRIFSVLELPLVNCHFIMNIYY